MWGQGQGRTEQETSQPILEGSMASYFPQELSESNNFCPTPLEKVRISPVNSQPIHAMPTCYNLYSIQQKRNEGQHNYCITLPPPLSNYSVHISEKLMDQQLAVTEQSCFVILLLWEVRKHLQFNTISITPWEEGQFGGQSANWILLGSTVMKQNVSAL